MFTTSTRPLTPDEAESLKGEGRFRPLLVELTITIALCGAVGAFVGAVGALIVGLVIKWAAPHLAETLPVWCLLLGLSVGFALLMAAWGAGTFLRMRQFVKEDLERGEVQILHVKDPVVVRQDEYNDEGPILFFDIGGGKILFLWGQWLLDPETYGAPVEELPDDLDVPEHINGLPDPYAFPSSEFTITRLPRSGNVLRTEVLGTYLPPARTVGRKEVRLIALGPSAILNGSLDALHTAVNTHDDRP
jgi:hypothetical protein